MEKITYHQKDSHTMKTPEIITRLTAAAVIMREHSQYNDDPECNGEGLAADSCDEAAALIKQLLEALQGLIDEVDRGEATEETEPLIQAAEIAIAKATNQ